MESIASILSLGFLIALIVAIVFGVKWYRSRKDKSGENYKKNKKRTIVTLVVMVVCFIGGSLAQNEADEEAAAAQYAKDKKNYKDEKKNFISQYAYVGAAAEDLSNKESNEWGDAIENSGDDFDVDSTIDSIEKKHSDDIDGLETLVAHMHEKDQEIQKNTAAPKREKKTIHSAYLSLKHFANQATYISGSYNDFNDKASKLDQEVADKTEELQDL